MTPSSVEAFETHRSWLLGVGYRFVGSWSDAEDLVQDTFLRWLSADHQQIVSPRAWLTKVLSNQALDFLKSARVTREQYVGEWLPEPVPDSYLALEDELTLQETVSIGLLMQMEALSAMERIVYVLREILQYDFNEVAQMVDKTPANCRKLASRGRKKIEQLPLNSEHNSRHRKMAEAFLSALKKGDMDQLMAILSEDAVLYSDGGGKASAIPRPMLGQHSVASFLAKVVSAQLHQDQGWHIEMAEINGENSVLVVFQSQIQTVFSFDCKAQKVHGIYAQRNPDKLQWVATHYNPTDVEKPPL